MHLKVVEIFKFVMMKRLNSYYGLYGAVLMPPGIAVILIATIGIDGWQGAPFPLLFLPVLILACWLNFRRFKKVYYDNGTIYLYNAFSDDPTIVEKENIAEIRKPGYFSSNYYRLIYYNENKDTKSVWFYRNWLLSDFNQVVDEINGGN